MTTPGTARPQDAAATQLAFSVSALATAAAAVSMLIPTWPPEGLLGVAIFYLAIGLAETSAPLQTLLGTISRLPFPQR